MCIRASRSVACILLITTSASADFVGVTTVIKDDPDTEFFCTQGNGDFVPGPLTVCNVYAAFDDPNNTLLSVGNGDLQVYNGQNPDVFYQHPLNFVVTSPSCAFVGFFPDLICDTFITIGYKCAPDPAGTDQTVPDADFNASEFQSNGHIVGGWFNAYPSNGQGVAGTWPDLQVLFLQSSVAQGLSLSGDIDIFWKDNATGEILAEQDVPIECAAACPDGEPCDDGDPCTENDTCTNGVCAGKGIDCDDGNECTADDCDPDTGCTHTPISGPCDDGDACTEGEQCGKDGCVRGGTPVDCDDGDLCTEDGCDPATGCTHEDIECPKGQVCDPASGECVEDQEPCECVNGKVTLCHIPQGNRANAHTINVACAARDWHLAHGDTCGPCE